NEELWHRILLSDSLQVAKSKRVPVIHLAMNHGLVVSAANHDVPIPEEAHPLLSAVSKAPREVALNDQRSDRSISAACICLQPRSSLSHMLTYSYVRPLQRNHRQDHDRKTLRRQNSTSHRRATTGRRRTTPHRRRCCPSSARIIPIASSSRGGASRRRSGSA